MGITDTQYKMIYDAVEDAMQASGLLGQPLNTMQKRNELYNATTHLYTQFPMEVFLYLNHGNT